MLVRCREGRPTKAEGNPEHPVNGGALCARGQASLQGLYDPDRIGHPIRRSPGGAGSPVGWDTALEEIAREVVLAGKNGRVAVISDLQSGGLAHLIVEWLKAFNSEMYLVYEPFSYDPLREANRAVFGPDAIPDYRLDESDFIVSFAADFLETWVSPVKWVRRFAERRVPEAGEMSRFVYIGPRLSMTGFNADEHILVPPGEERWVALAMLRVMAEEGMIRGRQDRPDLGLLSLPSDVTPERVGERLGVPGDRIRALARQFGRARAPLALGGLPVAAGRAAVESAVAANLLNAAADTSAVDFSRTHALGKTASASVVSDFVADLATHRAEALLIIGANPVYSLPPGHQLAQILEDFPTVVSLSTFEDETAERSAWVLPVDHPLESWGDYEPETAVRNIVQPVIKSRLDTRSVGDVLLGLARAAGLDVEQQFGAATYYEYLRRRWFRYAPDSGGPPSGADFWKAARRRGGHWTVEQRPTSLPPASANSLSFPLSPPPRSPALWVHPSSSLFDGRGANKRWLQEMPDVVNRSVWGSCVEVHPETARQLGIDAGQVVTIAAGSGEVRAPALLYRGMAPGVLGLQWGQGHTAHGRYAANRGVNAFRLLAADTSHGDPFPPVEASVSDLRERVVATDGEATQHGRDLVSAVRLSEIEDHHPEETYWPLPEGYEPERDLYPPVSYEQHRWAMAIDLSRCVGCEACLVACYAENNIPVVGEEMVAEGREMSWLRVERYYQWESQQAPALFLPMLCQHCDSAPCEPVCPVFAASHTEEGLNAQVYARCIGTRYCSNNCPYKVRRFNWSDSDWPGELSWQLNPDVTVRCRGVMEKCTFCVQRIREVEARARKEARPVGDGEITPACVQTCPAGVFVFGDLLDRDSRISRLVRGSRRRFQVLAELNAKPAVFYLKKVINDVERA
jgi:molybdopterin-containing oxidoreductase family iron-sulfur binding subunit